MVLKMRPVRHGGNRCGFGIRLACAAAMAIVGGIEARSQAVPSPNPARLEAPAAAAGASNSRQEAASAEIGQDLVAQWEGRPVRSISFIGIPASRLAPLPDHLAQAAGTPLRRENLKKSMRQLYATGLYETVEVEGTLEAGGVALVFRGQPSAFIGMVSVEGAKGATLNTQLERASQLAMGSRFTPVRLSQAIELMRNTLAENGFNEPAITQTQTPHPDEQLVDIAFHIVSGPQARVGTVEVAGDPGMSVEDFRRRARLGTGSRVDRNTSDRALARVLKHYQSQDRLEAEIKVESQHYAQNSNRTDFRFSANQGPVVKVQVEGISMSPARIKRVIPIFEEGAVDDDLLNEGNRRLRDYYQRLGYFDVKVDHEQQSAQTDQVTILYKVQLGPRRRIARVGVEGNHYFDSATLRELLSVRAADSIDRHGVYSQSLVAADSSALQAVYRNNGFSQVRITSETNAAESSKTGVPSDRSSSLGWETGVPSDRSSSLRRKTAPLSVLYRIEEGPQQRIGSVKLLGAQRVDPQKLLALLNTAAGQLLSPQNLAGDRDTLLTDYLSRGYDLVRIEVSQQIETSDVSKVDVVFHIFEGQQIFVRKVLLRGLHYTRPDTIAKAITLHPGDPLNQTALMEIQRNLYDFALFNEVDMATLNPTGDEPFKTVLIQATEARRWALTYGFGFEAQTGTPQNNCRAAQAGGVPCNPNGTTGVSPRVVLDITRNNLFGREQSVSLRGNYGLLEQKIDLLFQNPHFEGNRNFGLSLSGGYANSLDVSTYVASNLEGSIRWTEHFNTPGSRISKANFLIYEFDFRRVKVDASSLQVFPAEIEQLATAVRVAGPALTWIRDTRDSPLDAHRGTYTSFQEFLSDAPFGAQANFNRLDLSNSSYYQFDRGRFVLARNTRYGQERAFGTAVNELIPLPERLYAGGATSLRGFGQNSAGPRDPETGFPIGGAGALIESTELRLPPPTLPWLGNTVSFVIFHDMGNVFTNASDAWVSALRIHQPNRNNCSPPTTAEPTPTPTGPITSTGQQGTCNFNYFSHTPGLGLRYHTPAGPIRLDFSYNLNPPIYPVNIDYSQSPITADPHVGQASHFNFFFSLGQTF
jgi:outer membrane protein insertion porin family